MALSSLSDHVEVLVVGGGPGGYVAAIRAAKLGHNVALVDADSLGGTCLNYGCIPSKSLLSAADNVYTAGHQESMGIYADPYIDWEELLDWQATVVDTLTGGVKHLCDDAGVEFFQAQASFENPEEAVVTDADGTKKRISFDKTIIATGSRPIRLPQFPFEDDRVLTSREVFSLRSIPSKIIIIGAGYIGLELATVFVKLGTDVTVVELEANVLPRWNDELRMTIRDHVASLGVEFVFGELASECEVNNGVRLTTVTENGAENTRFAEHIVVAIGREPVTDTANVEALSVDLTENGFVAIDDQCRSSVDGVFAVGDVAGEPMLAHKASAEGLVAAETIAGETASIAEMVVPAVVFTDPEVAVVGHTETEAAEAGYDTMTGRMPFSASGRALTTASTNGFLQVVVDTETEQLLGAQVVGEHASEIVGELGLAVSLHLSARDVADVVHAHPTLAETVMEACAAAVDEGIHAPT